VRAEADVLGATVSVTVAFPVPDDGLALIHDGVVTDQDVFDSTVTVTDPPPAAMSVLLVAQASAQGPDCDSDTDADTAGDPFVVENNAEPFRALESGSTVAVSLTVAFPVPDDGLALTHDGTVTDQDVFDTTDTVVEPPSAGIFPHWLDDSVNVGCVVHIAYIVRDDGNAALLPGANVVPVPAAAVFHPAKK